MESYPEVFAIIPASGRVFGALSVIGVFLLLLIALFAYIAQSGRSTRFEVSDTRLRIRGTLYGRSIPMESLVVEEARAIDLGEERALQPATRTNGVGLPGYSAGWFRLNNGDRALLFVTERTHAVHVPTREGYDLILSVGDPDAFVGALRDASR